MMPFGGFFPYSAECRSSWSEKRTPAMQQRATGAACPRPRDVVDRERNIDGKRRVGAVNHHAEGRAVKPGVARGAYTVQLGCADSAGHAVDRGAHTRRGLSCPGASSCLCDCGFHQKHLTQEPSNIRSPPLGAIGEAARTPPPPRTEADRRSRTRGSVTHRPTSRATAARRLAGSRWRRR